MAPIFWRDKLILAKIESTEGVDPVPAGADALLVKNVSYTPMEGNDLSRELELPYFGDQGTIPVELRATISFEVELAPSGAEGSPPQWGKLLRACAVAETITKDGFDLVFRTWGDTRVARVRLAWLAVGELRQVDEWDLY